MHDSKQTSRRRLTLPVLLGAACVLTGIETAPAHAYAYVAPAAFSVVFGCTNQLAVSPPALSSGLNSRKSSAILAGQPSSLDLIMAQQAGDAAASVSYAERRGQSAVLAQILPCPATPSPWTTAIEAPAPPSGDFLGSSRVPIGSTHFDQAWRRVSKKSASVAAVDYLPKKTRQSDFAHVVKVNAWVNQNVEFVEDKVLYGQPDYWATAAETLRQLKGDCEDLAILKYQLLVTSGLDPASIYLTLVWDAVRRQDHAVLIVKLDGSHYLLDNETDEVLLADASHEYVARMSFSEQSSWVHGYTAWPAARQTSSIARAGYFSDKAVSKALATGFSR